MTTKLIGTACNVNWAHTPSRVRAAAHAAVRSTRLPGDTPDMLALLGCLLWAAERDLESADYSVVLGERTVFTLPGYSELCVQFSTRIATRITNGAIAYVVDNRLQVPGGRFSELRTVFDLPAMHEVTTVLRHLAGTAAAPDTYVQAKRMLMVLSRVLDYQYAFGPVWPKCVPCTVHDITRIGNGSTMILRTCAGGFTDAAKAAKLSLRIQDDAWTPRRT